MWGYETPQAPHMRLAHPAPAIWHGPDRMTVEDVMALDPGAARQVIAAHEAGHVAAYVAAGCTITGLGIGHRDGIGRYKCGGWVTGTADAVPAWDDLLVATAAGERAADRWLREAGLWTPDRGWGVEMGAIDDRDKAREHAARAGLTITYGDAGPADWVGIRDRTDRLLDTRWPLVQTLATLLTQAGTLVGEAVMAVIADHDHRHP